MTPEEMRSSIEPKSDQINYEDFIAGPRTYRVAGVRAGSKEQPIDIRLDGEDRVFRPCKSMRRLLIFAWGDNGHDWVGRSMTLFGDPDVTFGGAKVGGIRISHMSDLSGPEMGVALSVSRGKRTPYVVKRLDVPKERDTAPILAAAREHATKGKAAFQAHWRGLNKADRAVVQTIMAECRALAEGGEPEPAQPVDNSPAEEGYDLRDWHGEVVSVAPPDYWLAAYMSLLDRTREADRPALKKANQDVLNLLRGTA